jgi:hypothetical protein
MTEIDDESVLDTAQKTRAVALGYARAALVDENRTPLTSREALPKRFGVQEMTTLAEWILGSSHTITVVVVPDDVVDQVSRLNPAENFRPGGLLIVPESADMHRVSFPAEPTEEP